MAHRASAPVGNLFQGPPDDHVRLIDLERRDQCRRPAEGLEEKSGSGSASARVCSATPINSVTPTSSSPSRITAATCESIQYVHAFATETAVAISSRWKGVKSPVASRRGTGSSWASSNSRECATVGLP
jgi:hypothetical protein